MGVGWEVVEMKNSCASPDRPRLPPPATQGAGMKTCVDIRFSSQRKTTIVSLAGFNLQIFLVMSFSDTWVDNLIDPLTR
ncbi:hypothetical protein RRG08_048529 [Elysia crispata]|uniref:Uncharacterized protein n=1 Tax=Elysia crispata TaxID=231223 RepID=A0AAE1B548_9GAST|nr:hypothetical protein RRG08_048529 [Elysia crispata]